MACGARKPPGGSLPDLAFLGCHQSNKSAASPANSLRSFYTGLNKLSTSLSGPSFRIRIGPESVSLLLRRLFRRRRARRLGGRLALLGKFSDGHDLHLIIDRRVGTRRVKQLFLAEPDR